MRIMFYIMEGVFMFLVFTVFAAYTHFRKKDSEFNRETKYLIVFLIYLTLILRRR